MVQRMYVDINLMSLRDTSFLRAVDIIAATLFFSSAMVLVGLPKKLMRVFTLNCLGQLSRIYRSVVTPTFNIQYQCAKAVIQLVAQSVSFVELADQHSVCGVEHGGISIRRMEERVGAICRHRADLDEREVRVITEFALSGATSTEDEQQTMIDIDTFCHAIGSEDISIERIANLFDRERRPCLLERIFFPPRLWRLVHDPSRAVSKVGNRAQEQQHLELHNVEKRLCMSTMPLERKKSFMAQATNALLQDNSKSMLCPAGLEAEVETVGSELTALRLHVEKLQSQLFHEIEQRTEAEAKFRGELETGVTKLQAMAIGLSAVEARQQREASSMMQLCIETELKLQENVARLEREIAVAVKQAQETGRELREYAARLEGDVSGIIEQALQKFGMVASPIVSITAKVANKKLANNIDGDGSCDPPMMPVGAQLHPGLPLHSMPPPPGTVENARSMQPALDDEVGASCGRSHSTMGEPEGRKGSGSFWMDYVFRLQHRVEDMEDVTLRRRHPRMNGNRQEEFAAQSRKEDQWQSEAPSRWGRKRWPKQQEELTGEVETAYRL